MSLSFSPGDMFMIITRAWSCHLVRDHIDKTIDELEVGPLKMERVVTTDLMVFLRSEPYKYFEGSPPSDAVSNVICLHPEHGVCLLIGIPNQLLHKVST